MVVLYTYELIVIDGAKCADRSAPDNRATQLFTQNRAAITYLKAKPEAVRMTAIAASIRLEQLTRTLRKDDDLLCRGGLEEMMAGLKAGTTHEVTNDKTHYGRTVAVEAPPGYVPRFLPPATYQPVQERARAQMAAQLRKIAGLPD